MIVKMTNNTKLKILSLEDSIFDFELIRHQLINSGFNFNIDRVDTEKDFSTHIRENKYDIILADFNLPGYDSFGALYLCNEVCPDVPFICVSGSIGEEKAIELLKLGAVDYVIKDRPERLPFAIKRALEEAEESKNLKIAEDALLQSERNFRNSISESPLGIRIATIEGKTIYANKSFLNIYEFKSLEEFSKTPSINRYTPESYKQHLERKKIRKAGQDVYDYELSILRKNGEIRHIKVARSEVLWNGFIHFQIINQDITDEKRLTLDLISAKNKAEESDRLKSAFLANISHEIRTPMNGILGFAGLLKEPGISDENQQQYINIIEKSGQRMLNIINDIVEISRIETGELQAFLTETNINEQLEYIYNIFKSEVEQKNLKLNIKNNPESEESIVKTDREKITSIFSYLIKNALKFTQTGSIEFGYCKRKTCVNDLENYELEFFVKDTGIGIHDEQKEIIFERFRQGSELLSRNYDGAGLGLSISKAYVEVLGGKMWVESKLGFGSTFYFTIPYSLS